jgi:hypothetical protein
MKALTGTAIACLLILLTSLCIDAQNITWQRTYGDNNINYGYSICQTPDDGYIAVGRNRIGAQNYAFAMRLNMFGDTIWTKLFPGYSARQIESLSNGTYLIACGRGYNYYCIDMNGNLVWTKPDLGDRIGIITSSGFSTFYEGYMRKFDNLGNLVYQRDFANLIDSGRIISFGINSRGGITLIACRSYFCNSHSSVIINTDTNGQYSSHFMFSDITPLSNMVPVENMSMVAAGGGTYLAKYDSTGTILWRKNFDSGPPEASDVTSLIRTSDKGYVISGWYHNGDYNFYARLLKTDSLGNEEWRRLYGFGDHDEVYCVRQTSDTGFISIGIRDNYQLGDIYIIKTDREGYAFPPSAINDPGYQATVGGFILYPNYPNPFNPSTTIRFGIRTSGNVSLKVYDVLGREVAVLADEYLRAGSYERVFGSADLPSGVYFYTLRAGEFEKTLRMVVVK